MMDLFVGIETGTDSQCRYIINPLFILLVNHQMAGIEAVAKLFGLAPPVWVEE